ncbi:uncharacterized protein PAC_14779 [Phialocephala subalpina]|uniref:Uncharacterized protein n=1 Tax=Phialocephala subalpina TaxID=576137 RepID=A0A1L7XIK8_9HELO|nr:uncharacterized protein PAC_14779 [Phialocephala subalpina]
MDQTRGSVDDAASLAIVLGNTERFLKIRSYKVDSVGTSGVLPPLLNGSKLSMEYVDYTASTGGSVAGFCGCYMSSQATSSKQLQCFGVIGMGTQISSSSVSISSKLLEEKRPSLQEMPFSGIRNHREQNSQLFLAGQYAAVQALVNTTESKYRRMGQVTGLLFYSSNDEGHPNLLGQWTGAGEVYRLEKGLGLDVTTISPTCRIPTRPRLW